MKIGFGSDHGGYLLKAKLIALATKLGHETVDFGTNTPDSVDYPDFASPVAMGVSKGELDRGVVLCNTGIGASITANKAKGVRCALCSEPLSARNGCVHDWRFHGGGDIPCLAQHTVLR